MVAAMADDNGNGRITLALVVQKLDQLAEAVRDGNRRMLECYNENRASIRSEDERVSALERRADVNDEQHKTIVRDAEKREEQMREDAKTREKEMRQDATRQTTIGSVAAAITGVASAVLAAFGLRP